MAIGARSQSAKTYLERHLDEFLEADLEALVAHGIRALRDTLPNEIELNNKVSNNNNLCLASFGAKAAGKKSSSTSVLIIGDSLVVFP